MDPSARDIWHCPLRQRNQRPSRPRVIVADDDEDLRQLMVRTLRNAGFDVTDVADGMALLDRLVPENDEGAWATEYDIVITDVRMPGVERNRFAVACEPGLVAEPAEPRL